MKVNEATKAKHVIFYSFGVVSIVANSTRPNRIRIKLILLTAVGDPTNVKGPDVTFIYTLIQ